MWHEQKLFLCRQEHVNDSFFDPNINTIENEISQLLYDKGFSFFDIKIEEKIENQNVNINFVISDSPPKYAKEINITKLVKNNKIE